MSALLLPVHAGPGDYDLVENGEWLVEDRGGNDGFSAVVVKDVDGDGTDEAIVVGYAATAGAQPDAYVGVYRLDGASWVREAAYTKDFRGGFDALTGVAVRDYDGDNTEEIVVTGYGTNAHGTNTDVDVVVGILRKSGSTLVEEVGWYTKDFVGASGRKNYGQDVAVGNVDQDGGAELVVVTRDDFGAYVDTPMRVGVLSVQGGAIQEETWLTENPTGRLDYWSEVEIADLDGDGTNEIVTAGTYNEFWSSIAVAAYVKTGSTLSRESNLYTKRVGSQNNHGAGLVIGSVDGDAGLEAVVVGNFDDGSVNSDGGDLALGVLRYDGSTLAEEVGWLHEDVGQACAGLSYSGSDYWHSVALGDVDDDGTVEIVVTGGATGDCTDYDILAGAFSIDGAALTREVDWYREDRDSGLDIGTSTAIGNLDSDADLEVALCGYHRADAGSDGDGLAVALEAGTKPGTWVLVQDESNNPVQGARVYLHHCNGELCTDSMAGSTGADGKLWVAAARNDDDLAATSRIYEETTSKGNHNNWAYRVYLTSIDIAADGTPGLHTITDNTLTQTLTVKKDNALIGFHILASVEWDADADYLDLLDRGFREASAYLYDAADGQMFLEQITICDQGQRLTDADYRFYTSNQQKPEAHVGGLRQAGKRIHMGRYWNGQTAYSGWWTGKNGFRTMIHEFGHYGLYLYDEYFYYEFGVGLGPLERETQCTAGRTPGAPDDSDASLMDKQTESTEFCSTLAADPHVHDTHQHQKNGESCWETIDDEYSDSQVPARWNILRPDTDRGQVVAGPSYVPFSTTLTTVDTGTCTTNRTDRCDDEYWTFTHDDSPLADVGIYLKQADGTTVYQGKTNAAGRIEILGAAKGDRLTGSKNTTSRVCFKGHCVSKPTYVYVDSQVTCAGQGLQVQAAAAGGVLELEPAPFELTVTAGPGTAAGTLDVSATVTATLDGTPQARTIQGGAPTPLVTSLTYSPADEAYVGTVALNPSYDQQGIVEVAARDVDGHEMTVFVQFQIEDVSPLEDVTLYSEDGKAKLYLPPGSLPAETQIGFAIDDRSEPLTGTRTLVSGPYTVLASGGDTQLDSPASFVLSYDTEGIEGVDPTTLSIYRWDETTEDWVNQGGENWEDLQRVSTVIEELGTFALMAADNVPPASQVEPLPICQADESFEVRWSGTDAGTGLQAYDVQVREGTDGTWTDWITETREVEAVFTGELWHTYAFRSRARDWAGNQEAYPVEPDAETSVGCWVYLPLILRGG